MNDVWLTCVQCGDGRSDGLLAGTPDSKVMFARDAHAVLMFVRAGVMRSWNDIKFDVLLRLLGASSVKATHTDRGGKPMIQIAYPDGRVAFIAADEGIAVMPEA